MPQKRCIPKAVVQARGRLGALLRDGASPELIAAARAQLAEANAQNAAEKAVRAQAAAINAAAAVLALTGGDGHAAA